MRRWEISSRSVSGRAPAVATYNQCAGTNVNLIEQVWTIPAEQFKTGKAMQVILSPEALQILARRRKYASSEWVFPSHGKRGHLVEPKWAWGRLLKRAGIENLRIHDLRRTLGSWQAAQGSSLPIIGKSLGHARPESTAIYARLNLDSVRASVNAATAAIGKAGTAEPENKEGVK